MNFIGQTENELKNLEKIDEKNKNESMLLEIHVLVEFLILLQH